MYQMQMQLFGMMVQSAQTCTQSYAEALDAQARMVNNLSEVWSTAAKTVTTGATTTSKDDTATAFQLPEIPQSGRSWYRKPYENLFLAYWDQMLRTWQPVFLNAASGSNAFPAFPSATPSGMSFWGMNSANPWMPLSLWAAPWSAAASPMAMTAFANAANPAAAWADWGSKWTSDQANANLTIAKVFFPDKTEVTFSFPALQGLFAR